MTKYMLTLIDTLTQEQKDRVAVSMHIQSEIAFMVGELRGTKSLKDAVTENLHYS